MGRRLILLASVLAVAIPARAEAVLPPPPTNVTSPVIGGNLVVGGQLTAHPGTWDSSSLPITYSYQWEQCAADDGSGCASSLFVGPGAVPAADDEGKWIRLRTTATTVAGTANAVSTGVGPILQYVINPVAEFVTAQNVAAPVISGTVRAGELLDASEGLWYAPPGTIFQYQWYRCTEITCEKIPQAVTRYYTPAAADVGYRLAVEVRAVPPPLSLGSKVLATISEKTPTPVGNYCEGCAPVQQCEDGIDNDGDGKVDYPADPGCSGYGDNNEVDPAPSVECSDNIDNDGDGRTDYPYDPDCDYAQDQSESSNPPPPPPPPPPPSNSDVIAPGDGGSTSAIGIVVVNGRPQFANADFHSPSISSDQVDQVVTLVFGQNASIPRVNSRLENYFPYQKSYQGAAEWNDIGDYYNSLSWISNHGIRNSLPPFRGCDVHFREYAVGGSRSYTPYFGYYFVATTHKDCNEGFSDDYYGLNDDAARTVAAASAAQGYTVYQNIVWLGNAGYFQRDKTYYQSDGKATYIIVR